MRDLPALHEDDGEPLTAPPISTVHVKSLHPPSLRPGYAAIRPPRPPTAIMNKDLPPLPVTASHAEPSTSKPARSLSVSSATPTRPSTRVGAESPDIADMIAATPRPRRKSSSHYSGSSRSQSRPSSTRQSRTSSIRRSAHGSRRHSDNIAVPVPPLHRSSGEASQLAYARKHCDEDEESDYGEVLDGTGTVMDIRMLDREIEAKLERELDGFGSEE